MKLLQCEGIFSFRPDICPNLKYKDHWESPWWYPRFGGVWVAMPPTHHQIWGFSRQIPKSQIPLQDAKAAFLV